MLTGNVLLYVLIGLAIPFVLRRLGIEVPFLGANGPFTPVDPTPLTPPTAKDDILGLLEVLRLLKENKIAVQAHPTDGTVALTTGGVQVTTQVAK